MGSSVVKGAGARITAAVAVVASLLIVMTPAGAQQVPDGAGAVTPQTPG